MAIGMRNCAALVLLSLLMLATGACAARRCAPPKCL